MSFFNKQKIGEVRPNQLITTFGPGSVIDALNDSITIVDLDYWNADNIEAKKLLHECHLLKFLKP